MEASNLKSERPVVFSLERVQYRYPAGGPLFDSLDLTIYEGEKVGLIGPSGSGKSTLLKILAGLLAPQKGRAFFKSHELAKLSFAERKPILSGLGMTFQKDGLFDSWSSEENVLFSLEELGVEKKEREQLSRKWLKEVGLYEARHRFPHELSGGMQKRLGIARALVREPHTLLYDDPTAGLDPLTSKSIAELIAGTSRGPEITFVLVTHDPHQAYALCDRILFLLNGKVEASGSPEEILHSRKPAVRQFVKGLLEGPLTS